VLRQRELSVLKQPEMRQTVGALLKENVGRDLLREQGYVDLTITFVDPDATSTSSSLDEGTANPAEKILENIPTVRVILKKQTA